ncbi:deaminase [Spiroplasma turonicum]|uniref:tRNA-specific adenosine deaminase n=1 Tax=Spiroplasma turonicum TaxID=216946 RepID=A0A0K1P4N7_9MOLU|nr:deaminase [Spiroplasma turonicum]AKU79251.1 tRNA-specific adenosine deaminase [Spiroplasma turonicum]ALX70274.1 tRNA-specific adenosine deaminase [Spiroplasma turonicum]
MQENIFFNTLYKLIKKCKKTKDVPVASILIKEDKILFKSYNTRQKKYKFNNHAEILVIDKAFKKTKKKNLSEFTLYVNLKPCIMCIATLEQTNIKNVYYWLENEKVDYSLIKSNIKFNKVYNISQEELFKKELKNFFKELRG